jgi:predicted ATPase with chaperone activity
MTSAIVGQERAKEQIAHIGAQAIALVGPAGVGRRLVAAW